MPDLLDADEDFVMRSAFSQYPADADDKANTSHPVWFAAAQTRTPHSPCLRAGHSLASFSNRIYLFGGYCDYASYVASSPPDVDQLLHGARPGIGIHFNSLHQFCLDTDEWRILHPGCHPHEARGQALPKPRRHASMVVHGGSLFVYGGFDVDDTVLPDFWEFRIEAAMWVQISLLSPGPSPFPFPQDPLGVRRTHIPVARAEHTAVVDGNSMIVFGGYDGKKKLNDTFVFDFARRQWFRPPNADHNAPSRRCKHSAVLYNRCMFVVGGFQFHEGDNYASTDMHVLNLDSFTWSTILMGNSCPEALQGHKAVVCGDSMYIVGGKVRIRSRSVFPSVSLQHANFPSHQPFGTNEGFIGIQQLSPALADNAPHSISDIGVMTPSNPPVALNGVGPATVSVITPSSDTRSSGLNAVVFRYMFESNRWSVVETSGPTPTPRQLHAAVSLTLGGGRMSVFVFGGTDRSKQRFFHDLCELRDIRINQENVRPLCDTCSGAKVLLNNPMFSDVKFVVEGKAINAHRCILYARAEYFKNMFDSKMREACESEIVVPDIAYDVFLAVLEYIYSGTVEVTNGKLSVELLKAADMFHIEGLRNLCVEKVEEAVTVENVAFICQVADMHNASNLKQYCINFMMHNFRDVIKSQSFQNLMRQDPGGLGREILEAYSDSSPYSSGVKRPRK